MTIARVFVTLAGVAAIAWVLWYFLAPAGRPAGGGGGAAR
jgi:hypothetical protein